MKNNFLFGLCLGAIFPVLAYILTSYTAIVSAWFAEKPTALYIIAAALNFLVVRYCFRKQDPKEKTAKGIVLTTFLGMLLYLYFVKVVV